MEGIKTFADGLGVIVKTVYAHLPAAISNFTKYISTKKILLFAVGIILLRFVLKWLHKFIKRQRYLHSTLHQIDGMSGVEFEECLKAHFKSKGYAVKLTPKSGDYGVDLICKKGGERFVVQAKRYKGKIGISAVQQVIGGMHYYGCGQGMVITNSFFTRNAYELADRSNVVLWDRDTLQKNFRIVRKRSETKEGDTHEREEP